VAFSVDHNSAPTDTKKYVRTILHMSVYEYIANSDNSTTISRIALMDPCGAIPDWVVNMFSGNMVVMFNKWKHEY
jgi:hypothetical protein